MYVFALSSILLNCSEFQFTFAFCYYVINGIADDILCYCICTGICIFVIKYSFRVFYIMLTLVISIISNFNGSNTPGAIKRCSRQG